MKKNFLGKKWFFEDFLEDDLQTLEWGFRIDKEIYSKKNKFQKIEVFETKELGRVLVLDGFVQFATKDEFVYHQMLVHPAMFYSPKPEKVLIIGGGDGPTLREVLKHPVKEVVLVDIDKDVTDVCKKYFSSTLKNSFSDKRVKVFHEDALTFVKKFKNKFDVVIEDLTDPTPVAKFCWNKKFYKDISDSLTKDGVAIFQSGQLRESFAGKTRGELKKVFKFFEIHRAFINYFPFDEHTFSVGSNSVNLSKIDFSTIENRFKKSKIKLDYYSPEIHFSSRILPNKFN